MVLFENKNYSVPNGFHLKTFGDVTNSQLPGNSLAENGLPLAQITLKEKASGNCVEVVDLKSRLD